MKTDATSAASPPKPPAVHDAEYIIGRFSKPVLAELCETTRQAIGNWVRDGVPPLYHNRIVKEAKVRGFRGITHDSLEQGYELVRSQKAARRAERDAARQRSTSSRKAA